MRFAMVVENRCEANLKHEKIDGGSTRYVYDMDGRKHDLGPKTPERNAVDEVTIACQRCGILEKLRAEGGPPFGAYNEASRQAEAFLEASCPKWKEFQIRQSELRKSPNAYLYRSTLNTTADLFFPR